MHPVDSTAPIPSTASACSITRICIIRHGETDWNTIRRMQGHLDIPLNANGIEQARRAAIALRNMRFDAIYCSNLQRAQQTADLVAAQQSVAPQSLQSLRERHLGILQGLTRDEALQQQPEVQAHYDQRDPDYAPPEGESLKVLFRRTADTLESLADQHPGQTLLIVTHGGVLDVARRFVTGMPLQATRDFKLGNATLNWIERINLAWSIQVWNDDRHLQSALDEIQP